ncbi:KxDL motif-containing protein 1 [Blastocladiella emersonii ATCC 22665]|nr:KxDL motif-containing protein 1 [Blastocladiella emersonii ATCC 22665]
MQQPPASQVADPAAPSSSMSVPPSIESTPPASGTLGSPLSAAPKLSDILANTAAISARDEAVPFQLQTIELLSGTAKELASLNEYSSQRLQSNRENFRQATLQLRDLKVDLDSAHLRLHRILQRLQKSFPEAVAEAMAQHPMPDPDGEDEEG